MIHDLQEYKLKLSRIRRMDDIPDTDEDFVRFLMNTLDELSGALEKIDMLIRPYRFTQLPDEVKFQIYAIAAEKK
jgi:hypothetical protein